MLTFAKFVHWFARGVTAIVAALFLFVVAGEVFSPHSRPPSGFVEWIEITFLFAVVVGMLAAWKWELAGAVFSLGALAWWLLAVRFRGPITVVLVLSAPGLLYLSDWALHYGVPHDQNP